MFRQLPIEPTAGASPTQTSPPSLSIEKNDSAKSCDEIVQTLASGAHAALRELNTNDDKKKKRLGKLDRIKPSYITVNK